MHAGVHFGTCMVSPTDPHTLSAQQVDVQRAGYHHMFTKVCMHLDRFDQALEHARRALQQYRVVHGAKSKAIEEIQETFQVVQAAKDLGALLV